MKTSSHRSAPPPRRPPGARLPVHSHTTIKADGERDAEHRVYCDVREATVELSVCAGCARAREMPRNPTDAGAQVSCATGRREHHGIFDVTARMEIWLMYSNVLKNHKHGKDFASLMGKISSSHQGKSG